MNIADIRLKRDIENILTYGHKDENPRPKYADGTPAHTLSANHKVRHYNMQEDYFPICTLRYIPWRSAIKEMLWIFQDQSASLELLEGKYGVKYWHDWESKQYPGTIGQRYGATVKAYDQMNMLLDGLKNDPFGRRHIIDLYQFADFEQSDGLYPCAFCSIWNVRRVNSILYLDMMLIQRSGDMLTASGAGGINEVQYMVLMHLVARHCGYEVGAFTHVVANEQIYDRHIENANVLRHRDSVPCSPQLIINPDKKDFYSFTADDIVISDYDKDLIDSINSPLLFELGI